MGRGCDFSHLVLAFVFFTSELLGVEHFPKHVISCFMYIQHESKDVGNQFVILLFVSLSIKCDLNGCKIFCNNAVYML